MEELEKVAKELLETQCSKMQVVITFLVILELMKEGSILIHQEEIFGDIFITAAEGL